MRGTCQRMLLRGLLYELNVVLGFVMELILELPILSLPDQQGLALFHCSP